MAPRKQTVWAPSTMNRVAAFIALTEYFLRQDLLLRAAIDEVDQALAGLQTTRQLLRELQRTNLVLQRTGRLRATGDSAPEEPRATPLRYSGVTVAEAARILNLSEEHVRRLLRRGELEGIAFGGRVGWRLARDYVEGLAADQRAARQGQASARRRPPRKTPRS